MSARDETWVRGLLAPLAGVEPVVLQEPHAKPLRGRVLLVAALAAVGLAFVTVAVAGGIGPFGGIGAFDRPQQPADRDSGVSFLIEMFNDPSRWPAGALPAAIVPDSVRALGQFSDGTRTYVAKRTNGGLCLFSTDGPGAGSHLGGGCGGPPRSDLPTTASTFLHGANTVTYGLTRDGVTSVSFLVHGNERTVPVVDNAWMYEDEDAWKYEGKPSPPESITVHYADGTSETFDPRSRVTR